MPRFGRNVMENINRKKQNEKIEMSDKTRKIIVGFLSITISLAMLGYTVGTFFGLNHTSVPKAKNKVLEKVK